jgi:hypothetical protein
MAGGGVGVGPGMVSPQQAMFMQQQAMGGPRGPFTQQGPGGVLQGPLAYLEKTTSNIGILALQFYISVICSFGRHDGREKVTRAREGAR